MRDDCLAGLMGDLSAEDPFQTFESVPDPA